MNISRIEWESGREGIELGPHGATGLANHHMDFIALDGSVPLRLDFDDAVEVESDGKRALVWNVCDQPWESGDLLMLRVSESEPGLTGAVKANVQCPTDGNRPPEFTSSGYTFEIPETATPTTVVGSVVAVDLDDGDMVSYSILSGTGHGRFAINSTAGEITVVGMLDYETARAYALTVEASDGHGGLSRAVVRVVVVNVPEPPTAPQNLTATSTHDSVTLNWDPPDDPTVTGYSITWEEARPDALSEVINYSGYATMFVARGWLEPETEYIFGVRFSNSEADGDVSSIMVMTLAAQ